MTVFPTRALLAAGTTLLATAAGAQTTTGMAQMLSMTGHCDRLRLGERDLTATCSAKLVKIINPNGRISVYFLLADSRAVSFSGMDDKDAAPDTDVMHLDKVFTTRLDTLDAPDAFPASGTCRFGNTMKGPMTIACEGTFTEGGTFSASFTTDGSPPT